MTHQVGSISSARPTSSMSSRMLQYPRLNIRGCERRDLVQLRGSRGNRRCCALHTSLHAVARANSSASIRSCSRELSSRVATGATTSAEVGGPVVPAPRAPAWQGTHRTHRRNGRIRIVCDNSRGTGDANLIGHPARHRETLTMSESVLIDAASNRPAHA